MPQPQSLELIQAVTKFLETVNTFDVAHPSEHLARLDHLIGFNSAFPSVTAPLLPSRVELLSRAEAVAGELAPWVTTKIMDENLLVDDVLFSIEALEWKSKQEHLDNPSAYFCKVLKDKQSKGENLKNAA
ncbi:MAG: hypothetical protein WBG73_18990 [Coleofasciculaceae cyanobacterium]